MRLDLTGKPAGTVTATEARHATERLAAAKRASKVASTSTIAQTSKTESPPAASATPKASNISNRRVATEPTTPGQKRLSLGDLKRAAAARKAIALNREV